MPGGVTEFSFPSQELPIAILSAVLAVLFHLRGRGTVRADWGAACLQTVQKSCRDDKHEVESNRGFRAEFYRCGSLRRAH